MAIQMTRAEYEATYGVKPTFSSMPVEEMDTDPEPVQMTKAEYNAKYRPELVPKTKEQEREETPQYKIGKAVVDVTPIGIPIKQFQSAKSGVERFAQGYTQVSDSMKQGTIKEKVNLLKTGIENQFLGGVETVLSPVSGLIKWGAELPGVKQVIGAFDKNIQQPIVDKLSDSPKLQDLAKNVTQEDAESLLTLGLLLFGGAKSKQIKEAVTGGVRDVTYKVMGEPGVKGSGLIPKVETGISNFVKQQNTKQVNNIATELAAVENSYSAIRRSNLVEKDGGEASRLRIAQAHREAGILDNIVDTNGTISTRQPGGAVDKYYKAVLEGQEGVIRKNLENEGKTVNIKEVENNLLNEIDKKFEGSELIAARNGVIREMEGLKARANEFGDIPLAKIQDIKISTTKNIDYTKPLSATYKKLKARVYKETIENKSDVSVEVDGKSYKIKDINEKLGEFYTDIERLSSLDGKKAEGGRLGKYVARTVGSLVGGAAGAVAGPAGAAIGGAIGAEAGGILKGNAMASKFGKGRGGTIETNPVLAQAKKKGELGKTIDLRIPDKKVGAPKDIKKTKEIIEIEARISKNVEAQKKAIKKGDFTLVATLKSIYEALVIKLKSLIKELKASNKQGGYIKNPFAKEAQSNNVGKRNAIQAKTNTITNTDIPKSITPTKEVSSVPNKIGELKTNRFGIVDMTKGEPKIAKSTGFGQDKILSKGKLTKSELEKLIEEIPLKNESNNRIILENDNYRIILSKNWKDKPTQLWLMNVIKK